MKRKVNTTKRLRSKRHRDAFVAAQIKQGIPFQIRALRNQRDWTQEQLREKSGLQQSSVSRIENPNYKSSINLKTLRALASAFDVGLVVRFVSFGDLIEWASDLVPGSLEVPSFEDDPQCREWLEAPSNTIVAPEIPIVIVDTTGLGSTETDTQMLPIVPTVPAYALVN